METTLNEISIGATPFATTNAWTTWDSVSISISLVQGLNALKLSSIGSDGGPNIDEFEFDIAGVTLWRDDSTTTLVKVPRVSQIYYDAARGVLSASSAGFAQIEAFDLKGQRIAAISKRVSAGETSLSLNKEKLPKGTYWIQVHFNGKIIVSKGMTNLK
jgi:rhamnogalacturonan endolyase